MILGPDIAEVILATWIKGIHAASNLQTGGSLVRRLHCHSTPDYHIGPI